MIKKEVNERVKYLRNVLELTQEKFAKQIAISTSYLAGIEVGEKRVNDRVVLLICHGFGINEHWLKRGEGEMFSKDQDVVVSKMLAIFNALTPELQLCALQQVQALAEFKNLVDWTASKK